MFQWSPQCTCTLQTEIMHTLILDVETKTSTYTYCTLACYIYIYIHIYNHAQPQCAKKHTRQTAVGEGGRGGTVTKFFVLPKIVPPDKL